MCIDQRYAGVDWPVDCAGNLSSEAGASCKVDVATIAEQILANEAKQQVQDAIEEKADHSLKSSLVIEVLPSLAEWT